jgi:hypothetical protein
MILLNRSKIKSFIQGLNAEESCQVLKILLDVNPDLMKKVYDIAMQVAGDVDADTILDEVYHELDALDTDDLYSRSGKTRYGYVDPNEEAWEMFEEALQPFIDEMKKNQQRELPAIAKTYCMGIIKGILRFEEESNSDFKDWVEDAPGEYVASVIKEWKKGNPDNEDIIEIMSVVEGDPS